MPADVRRGQVRDVIARTMLVSSLVVLSASGCSEDAGVPPPPGPELLCRPTQAVCDADTICGDTGCGRAFDRAYQVRVASVRVPGKRDGECPDDRNCVPPRVTVYFTEVDRPILGGPDAPARAEIVVTEGSALIVDAGVRDCMILLTPAGLGSGEVDCRDGGMSATLSLVAMPL